jgi:choline dehydrogenase
MPKKKYLVTLNAEEREQLEHLWKEDIVMKIRASQQEAMPNTRPASRACPDQGAFSGGHREPAFAERVRTNQQRLRSHLKTHYDFIVCGSGSSGSVVAGRLAEHAEVSVLLLEAGGCDDVPSVQEAHQWFLNLGSERDWGFRAQPNPHLHGRAMPLPMGKVLGGGSSINGMAWARGHKHD